VRRREFRKGQVETAG